MTHVRAAAPILRNLLLSGLLAAAALPAEGAPRVVEASVASSGMVLLSLEARLDTDGRLSFDVPQRHLDDWLKSVRLPPGWTLVLAPDPERLALPGPDGGPDALVAALAGQPVRHLRQGRAIQAGRIAGLRPPSGQEGADPSPLLALHGPDGITLEPWRPGDRLEAAEPRLAAALEAALAARAGQSIEPRRSLLLQGPPSAEGRIEILLGGPAWAASHRATVAPDGAARLETLAHVRNGTGLPWEGVRLTLVSGEARVLAAPLSVPRQPRREPPEPARQARALPAPAPMAAGAAARPPFADGVALEAAPPPPAEIVQGQPAAAVFRLAAPLHLPDGALATLPLAAEPADGRLVRSLRVGGGSVSVALRLRRPDAASDLPPGVLTATQGGGHLGDALLPPWPGGETRRVPLATDPAVSASERRETRLRGEQAWARAGVLHLRSAEETRIHVSARNARAEPVVLDLWAEIPPEAAPLAGAPEGPGRIAAAAEIPARGTAEAVLAWRTPARWSAPALSADPAEIRRRLDGAAQDAPGVADALAWASRLEARADLQARLQEADRRVARLAQGVSPERERTARLLQGAEQAEALAALAQAARVHAQAIAQRDRLGTDLESLEAGIRRDGARLSFGPQP